MIGLLIFLALSVIASAFGRRDWAVICWILAISSLGCWALGQWARGGEELG